MRLTTIEEERREVWSGLLDGMDQTAGDPAREAACAFLLRHLIDDGLSRRAPAPVN